MREATLKQGGIVFLVKVYYYCEAIKTAESTALRLDMGALNNSKKLVQENEAKEES